MVELSPSTQEVSGSNPVVDKIKLLSTVIKKSGREWPAIKHIFPNTDYFQKNQSLS